MYTKHAHTEHTHKNTHMVCVMCYRKQSKAQSEGVEQQTQAAVEAKRAGEVTQALMEATMEREWAQKGREEKERREVAESRLKAMLELKQSIAASKASLYHVCT